VEEETVKNVKHAFKSLAEFDKVFFPQSGGKPVRTPVYPTPIESRLLRSTLREEQHSNVLED
jgi:hypothetical protein